MVCVSSAPWQLSYVNPDSKEPSFLRKLRGEYGVNDVSRHGQQFARPRRQRNSAEEYDDEPIYVHETEPHEPMTKAKYDALFGTSKNAPDTEGVHGPPSPKGEQSDRNVALSYNTEPSYSSHQGRATSPDVQLKQHTAVIGGVSKKRTAKVIGDDDVADKTNKTTGPPGKMKKQGSKAKKQKLSFLDD
ncbi:MAG: hypothetical protein Q9219_003650 [cf. Caloplaca sp. 3 TL-2023]